MLNEVLRSFITVWYWGILFAIAVVFISDVFTPYRYNRVKGFYGGVTTTRNRSRRSRTVQKKYIYGYTLRGKQYIAPLPYVNENMSKGDEVILYVHKNNSTKVKLGRFSTHTYLLVLSTIAVPTVICTGIVIGKLLVDWIR